MSKHVSRKQRWTAESPTQHTSAVGKVVYQQRAWYGLLDYKLRAEEGGPMPVWVPHAQRLGPFKRPRNAMVAVEREATLLKNRHGDGILFGNQPWAEA
jgi:hypothetical protein